MDNNLFVNILQNTDRIETESLLNKYYQIKGLNIFDSAEMAQNNLNQFVDDCNAEIKYCRNKNIPSIFLNVTNNILNVNRDYFLIMNIKEDLLNLTWEQFEDFASIYIEKTFGTLDTWVSQRTRDGGVDFTARIPFKSNYSQNIYGFIEFYGQAKKYEANVGRVEIDKFTAYANRQKRGNTFPAQIFCILTTSDFNIDAQKEIKANSFLSFNGLQMAQLIYSYLSNNTENLNPFAQFGISL
jgi:hypothetical protein